MKPYLLSFQLENKWVKAMGKKILVHNLYVQKHQGI